MSTVIVYLVVLISMTCDGMARREGSADAPHSTRPDSVLGEVTLRYNLNPGERYTYKLLTDQVVVNNHSTRLQTIFEVSAIAKDVRGNTRCRITLASDPDRDTSALHGTDLEKKRFAGYRKWVQEQAFETVLDALGRVIASTVVAKDDTTEGGVAEPLSERATQFVNTPREDQAIPSLMSFILPTTSVVGTIARGTEWSDTFTLESKTQFAPAIRQGQTTRPVRVQDSLFRKTRVDSIVVLDGRQQCFLAIETDRKNAGGSRFVAFSRLQRDVPTGLVLSLQEKAYRIIDDDPILHYTASVVLVREMSTSLQSLDDGPSIIQSK